MAGFTILIVDFRIILDYRAPISAPRTFYSSSWFILSAESIDKWQVGRSSWVRIVESMSQGLPISLKPWTLKATNHCESSFGYQIDCLRFVWLIEISCSRLFPINLKLHWNSFRPKPVNISLCIKSSGPLLSPSDLISASTPNHCPNPIIPCDERRPRQGLSNLDSDDWLLSRLSVIPSTARSHSRAKPSISLPRAWGIWGMPVSPLFAFFFTFQPTTRTLSVDFYSFELFPLLLSLLPSLSILFFHDTKHQFLINSRGILVLLSCSVSKWRDKRREQNRAGRSGLPPQPLAEALLHI